MRRAVVLLVVVLAVVAGAGIAVAGDPPSLRAEGPTSVSGTDASAVFTVGDRTVRQVRYRHRGVLEYTFSVRNDGRLAITITGLHAPERQPRLFRLLTVAGPRGAAEFTVAAGASVPVTVRLRMRGCESLSARAGSFATGVELETRRARVLHDVVRLWFPEELHTGSPREAFCPGSTATSRPPG
jgi:hypothetical protein